MTQEEKSLLLKDLCARWSYGLKCKCPILSDETYTIVGIELNDDCSIPMVGLKTIRGSYIYSPLEEVKPFLRPMSSMTEEEVIEYRHLIAFSGNPSGSANFIDWLNANHFDFRDLIPKGLALEASENMYKI